MVPVLQHARCRCGWYSWLQGILEGASQKSGIENYYQSMALTQISITQQFHEKREVHLHHLYEKQSNVCIQLGRTGGVVKQANDVMRNIEAVC